MSLTKSQKNDLYLLFRVVLFGVVGSALFFLGRNSFNKLLTYIQSFGLSETASLWLIVGGGVTILVLGARLVFKKQVQVKSTLKKIFLGG